MDRPIELTAETLWNEVAGRLKGALNETTYRTWFAEAEGAELSDDAFVLGVPNDFTPVSYTHLTLPTIYSV